MVSPKAMEFGGWQEADGNRGGKNHWYQRQLSSANNVDRSYCSTAQIYIIKQYVAMIVKYTWLIITKLCGHNEGHVDDIIVSLKDTENPKFFSPSFHHQNIKRNKCSDV